MTIGAADTTAALPVMPAWVPGYAKGALSEMTVSTRAKGLSYIYDNFDNVNDWINVYGRLGVSGGSTSDVVATGISYSAGRHKTQLLSDNCRAKVKIQDGTVIYGESRVVICADPRFNRYYGIAIRKRLIGSQVSIIRGRSSISVDKYETVGVTMNAGDEYEVWYDRANSTVRVYENGSEIAKKYFEPNDIPHGPGCRWTGVVMGANWLIDIGPNFDSFEAFDVVEPTPKVYDPVDSLTLKNTWTAVSGTARVNRHLLQPLSIGPNGSSAAIRWNTEMDTNSVKVVFTAYWFFSQGTYTVVVRSNAAMTNWIGIRFSDGILDSVQAVTGTGPLTVTPRGNSAELRVTPGQQYTITYDDATKTIRLFRGAKRSPIIEWAASTNFTPSGKYVGMTWTRSNSIQPAIEPTVFEAYNVDANQPLP